MHLVQLPSDHHALFFEVMKYIDRMYIYDLLEDIRGGHVQPSFAFFHK